MSLAPVVIRTAASVPYDNTTSGLTASDVQAALDEISSTSGTIGGGGAATRVAYFSDATTLTTEANFAYIEGTDTLNVRNIQADSGETFVLANDAGAAHLTISPTAFTIGALLVPSGDGTIALGSISSELAFSEVITQGLAAANTNLTILGGTALFADAFDVVIQGGASLVSGTGGDIRLVGGSGPTANGIVQIESNFNPDVNNTIDLGTSSLAYKEIHTLNTIFKGSTSGNLTVTAPAAITDYTMILPGAVAAGAGYVLTDAAGDGVLSWAATSGGAGISGTPADNQIAVWVDATDIEGDTNFTWDGSILAVTGAVSVGAHGWTMAANDVASGSSATNRIVYDDNASNFYVAGGSAGTSMDFLIFHNDNTSATSDARLTLQVAGTSGGDPEIVFGVPGGSPANWSLGVDNSDSDIFKIGPANGVSSITTGLEIAAAGVVTIISSVDGTPTFALENTAANASGVFFETYHNSATEADNDIIYSASHYGNNDAGSPEKIEMGRFEVISNDVTDGSEDGDMAWHIMQAGTLREVMRLDSWANPADTRLALTSFDAFNGPTLLMDYIGGSPNSADKVGAVLFTGEDSGLAAQTYGEMYCQSVTTTAGSERGLIEFNIGSNGGTIPVLRLGGVSGDESVIVNPAENATIKFRVAGDSLSRMIYTDPTATTENIALLAGSAPGWNTMDRGIFIGDMTTAPTGNPTSGLYVYVDSGAGKARGGSGTVTTWAPAEPHCPNCDRDFALEWRNDKYGHLEICMWCLTDALSETGIDVTRYARKKTA